MAEVFRQRLGPALVAENVITPAQLKEAQELQQRAPHFTLGQILNLTFRVPMSLIDEVNVRHVALPQFVPALMERLKSLAVKDRFAQGMNLEELKPTVAYELLRFDTQGSVTRRYVREGEGWAKAKEGMNMLTFLHLEVTLSSPAYEAVTGKVNALHDTVKRKLSLTDDNDIFKTNLYYPLRTSIRKALATS